MKEAILTTVSAVVSTTQESTTKLKEDHLEGEKVFEILIN